MPAPVDAKTMLALSMQLCCAGVLVQSLEFVWNWRELRDDRLLGWSPATTPATNPVTMLMRFLYQYPVSPLLLLWRAVAAGACLFLPYGSNLVFWLLGSLLLGQMYFNRRFAHIRGNSDTMKLVCLGAVFSGSFPTVSAKLQSAALLFMAFQASLAYLTTGYDKLRSPLWREGTRLVQILRDSNYRFPSLGNMLERWPCALAVCVWSVILLELVLPFSVVLPPAGFWILIGGGLAFHAIVAFTMGLHGFFWSFSATYPAFYFVHSHWIALHA